MIAGARESKLCKGILAALALLACFAALPDADSWSARPGVDDVAARALSTTNDGLSRYLDPAMVMYKNATPPWQPPGQPPDQFDVCGRPAGSMQHRGRGNSNTPLARNLPEESGRWC